MEQDPADEPASELLQKIAKERAQLINGGKIKKPKTLQDLAPEEGALPKPTSWEWSRLGSLFSIVYGKGLPNSKLTEEGYTVFGANGIIGKYTQYLYEDAQLLVSCRGAYSGKPNISPEFCFVTSNSLILQNTWRHLSLKYFYYALSIAKKEKIVTGSAQPQVTTTNLEPFLVTVPPLAEQHRIVAKVDELMALCDQLELRQEDSVRTHGTLVQTLLGALTAASERGQFAQAWQRIASHFDTLFTTESSIDQLKQTILQLAVMGKLVEQDPADEPVNDLVKRILSERRKLARTKATVVQAMSAENVLDYDIPRSWQWQRLDDLLVLGPTNGFSPKAVSHETPVRSLTLSATTSGKFKGEHSKFITTEVEPNSDLWLSDGDILVQRGNSIEYVGVAAVYRGEPNCFVYPDLMMKLRVSSAVDVDFIHLAMSNEAARDFLRARASGTSGSMPKINQPTLKNLPIPIPPLAEQKRIVAKVEELVTLCDRLKANLQTAQATQLDLADSLVEAAIG